MKTAESPIFVQFSRVHLIGGGFSAYLQQQKAILAAREPNGHFGRIIKASGKVFVIEYYLSEKLDTLYTLSGHLVRAGDKREQERKDVREFIAGIRELEEENE